ncbi:MAG: hypothetical protein ABI824_12945 [Acidobacteriota bacterium]
MTSHPANAIPVVRRPVATSELFLQIFVAFTTHKETAEAIRATRLLLQGLNARICVLVAREVPFPLPLTEPPVAVTFTEDRLREVVGYDAHIPATVDVFLCRDRLEAIRQSLPTGATVVVGGRNRWYRRDRRKLIRILREDGHKVVLVEENSPV